MAAGRVRCVAQDGELTDVWYHRTWSCLAVPVDRSTSGVAVAVPSRVAEFIGVGDAFVSEAYDVAFGEEIGAWSEPAGVPEFGQVRFAVFAEAEFGRSLIEYAAAGDVHDMLSFLF